MLCVKENTFLGRELWRGILLDKKAMQAKTRVLLEQLNCSAPATARIDTLLNSYKQMVEITKALSRHAKALVLDEPTAVRTKTETAVRFEQVQALRAEGALMFCSFIPRRNPYRRMPTWC